MKEKIRLDVALFERGFVDSREKAKLTVVSSTSIVEGGAHDVITKDTTSNV